MNTLYEFNNEITKKEAFLVMNALQDELECAILLGCKANEKLKSWLSDMPSTRDADIHNSKPYETYSSVPVIYAWDDDIFEIIYRKK